MFSSLLRSPTVTITVEEEDVVLCPAPALIGEPSDDPFVRGTVELSLPSSRAVKCIKVYLEGTCEANGGSGFPYESSTTLSKKLVVDIGGPPLEPGTHTYNYSFIIPSTTAVFERCRYGRVRHHVRAKVEFSSGFSYSISASPKLVALVAAEPTPHDGHEPFDLHSQHFSEELGPVGVSIYSPHLTVSSLVNVRVTLPSPLTPLTILSIKPAVNQFYTITYDDPDLIAHPPPTTIYLKPLADSSAPLPTSALSLDEPFTADPSPLVVLGVGEEYSYCRLMRCPNDNFMRPTTLEGTETRIRVRSELVVEIAYRTEGGEEKRMIISKPAMIGACWVVVDNSNLPPYALVPPNTARYHMPDKCMCDLSWKEMVEKDGKLVLPRMPEAGDGAQAEAIAVDEGVLDFPLEPTFAEHLEEASEEVIDFAEVHGSSRRKDLQQTADEIVEVSKTLKKTSKKVMGVQDDWKGDIRACDKLERYLVSVNTGITALSPLIQQLEAHKIKEHHVPGWMAPAPLMYGGVPTRDVSRDSSVASSFTVPRLHYSQHNPDPTDPHLQPRFRSLLDPLMTQLNRCGVKKNDVQGWSLLSGQVREDANSALISITEYRESAIVSGPDPLTYGGVSAQGNIAGPSTAPSFTPQFHYSQHSPNPTDPHLQHRFRSLRRLAPPPDPPIFTKREFITLKADFFAQQAEYKAELAQMSDKVLSLSRQLVQSRSAALASERFLLMRCGMYNTRGILEIALEKYALGTPEVVNTSATGRLAFLSKSPEFQQFLSTEAPELGLNTTTNSIQQAVPEIYRYLSAHAHKFPQNTGGVQLYATTPAAYNGAIVIVLRFLKQKGCNEHGVELET
ncbi:Arrestin-like, N-terminal and Immunoglobulin E-set domain protein [Pseudohyphozyma bogoriensis]|nr:Arrestin-like, N-terminal and Immunoglobulin E-set domain protein [Pseudohyphozyma bogoriensis]